MVAIRFTKDFDTAYIYHGGKSEIAAREALVKRHKRESFMLATKLPAWEIKKEEGRIRHFGFSFHGSPELLEEVLSIPQIGCTACKYCCDGCPQHLPIIELMKEAAGILDQK